MNKKQSEEAVSCTALFELGGCLRVPKLVSSGNADNRRLNSAGLQRTVDGELDA